MKIICKQCIWKYTKIAFYLLIRNILYYAIYNMHIQFVSTMLNIYYVYNDIPSAIAVFLRWC